MAAASRCGRKYRDIGWLDTAAARGPLPQHFRDRSRLWYPCRHLPNIFDPYFTTKTNGSGLGLATAYAIVIKHNGYMTATRR